MSKSATGVIKKAFDSVESSYLKALLKFMRFGEHFLRAIHAIYSAPTTLIKVNGVCSDCFTLSRGMHQGCPLSLILFVLAIEPLAAAIRSDPDIRGVVIGDVEYKLSHLLWLPVQFLVRCRVLVLIFKAMSGLEPAYLQNHLPWYVPR